MIQHARIWVDGVEWSGITIASLEIDGGRNNKTSMPDATTMGAAIILPTNIQPPRLGARVHVKGWLTPHQHITPPTEANSSRALFAGTITDLAMEGDVLSLVAADPTPELQGINVGDTPWPVESWEARTGHVWNALRTAAGVPSWMPPWSDLWAQFYFPAWNYWQLGRDVDRQPGIDLLTEYMAPYNVAFFYVPHWDVGLGNAVGVPATPDLWAPSVRIRSGLEDHPAWSNPQPGFHDSIISNDPPYRLWRNKSSYVSRWKIGYNDNTVDPPNAVSVQVVDAAAESAYGPRGGEWNTSLLAQYVGSPITDATDLGNMWLARTKTPAWQVDNVTLIFEPFALEGQPAAENWWDSWGALLKFGPGQVGRNILIQLDPGQPTRKAIVEGMRIAHTPDGWTVELNMSPSVFYDAVLTTRIMGPIPATVYGATVVLADLYVTQYDDMTRVDGGTVTQGGNVWPVLASGAVAPVTITPLAVGDNAVTLTYTPPAGAPYSGTTRNATIVRAASTGAWHNVWSESWEAAA